MNSELLIKGLKDLGIPVSPNQVEQLNTFYKLLVEWNEHMNLTGITAYEEVVVKHFLDSVNMIQVYDLNLVKTVIDVGTGAGFPGLPLKIVFPHLDIVLLDALNKRVQFMNHVIDTLGLTEVEAVHERAEILAKQEDYRENFDLCVSRAVSNLATLSEYCLPFVKKEGYFVSYKSIQSDTEIDEASNALKVLGGVREKVIDQVIINTDLDRRYVIIKKVDDTPIKYPRKAGKPSKNPL